MALDQQEQSKKIEEEPLSFALKHGFKPALETLIGIKPGTVLYVSTDNSLSGLGFKFFSTDLLRQEDYTLLNRRIQSQEEALSKVHAYDINIQFNFAAFENKHSLLFTTKHSTNGSPIGLYVGDLIVGTRGAVDIIVLMKILMQEDIGWISFTRYRSDVVGLELQ